MPTNFPTSLDNFTNPTSSDNLDTTGVVHHEQHSNENDALEAIEAKVGIDGSAVTSSLDYKVAQRPTGVSGTSNKIAKYTGAGTIANSTITDDGSAVYGATAALQQNNQLCQGRLSLLFGSPVSVADQFGATPTSTDTGAETVTWSSNAPGWITGQAVTITTSVGGLTAGTIYYMRNTSGNTYSFHTTYADAQSGSSAVNLTAGITNLLCPAVSLEPLNGKVVYLYNGSNWQPFTIPTPCIALPISSTVTPFDVFAYDNSGTLAIEVLAWTNDTTRATALTTQDGIYVKNGATGRLYLGTGRTGSNAYSCLDGGQFRLLWNNYNRVSKSLTWFAPDTSHTYNTAAWRYWNGTSQSRVEWVQGLGQDSFILYGQAVPANGVAASIAIGVDENAPSFPAGSLLSLVRLNSATDFWMMTTAYSGTVAAGFHYGAMLEYVLASTSLFGTDSTFPIRSGIVGTMRG